MARKQPTDRELIEDSHHVLYEMEQMTGAVNQLASAELNPDNPLPDVLSNALIENVAMHGRALIEFAYPTQDNPRPDDVAAVDFLPDWPNIRPPLSTFLKEVKRRADKEIMHVTRARSIDPAKRTWQYGVIHNELAPVMALFIVEVPNSKVKPEFPRQARAVFPLAVQLERNRKADDNRRLVESAHSPLTFGATQASPDLDVIGEE
jgi:hypothetical protein